MFYEGPAAVDHYIWNNIKVLISSHHPGMT